MAKKTTAQIEFKAVTSEFTSGIKDMNSSLNTMQNQLKLNSAQLKGNGDSVELLQNRQQILQNELQASSQKVELTRQALQEAKTILGETSTEYKNLENALIRAQTQQQSIQNEINQTNNRLEELHNSANDAGDGIENLSNEMQDTADESSRFGDILAASLASEAITGALEKITGALDAVKDRLVGFALDSESGFNSLIAKTGASKEEFEGLEEIMNQIYADNFGEDMNDIADVMSTVKQQTGATGDELLKTSENALLLRDTFDFDVNESVRSANMLMQQFGLTSDEAYNLIAQGAQGGLDKNGDLLDTINEYSVHFKQAGYSADEMFNSLKNGTDAGTFSVDKLGDAVKEFGIRMKDGTADETIKKLGLDVDDVTKRFAQGGEVGADAMGEIIDALFNVKDPLKQNTLGTQLFGTMWEDLGAVGVEALMDINGEIDGTSSNLKDLNNIKYNDLGSAIEGIKRGFEADLKPALDFVLQGIEMVVTAFSNLPQGVQTTIAVITFLAITVLTLVTAFGAITACITAAIPVFTAIAGSIAGVIAFIGGISAPVLIVIGVITALIAVGVALYNNWNTISAYASSIWNGICTIVSNVGNAIAGNVKKDFQDLKNNISIIWNGIKTVISNVINIVKSVVQAGFGLVNTYIVNPIRNAYNSVSSVFSNIYNTINTKINNAKNAVKRGIDAIKGFFNFKFSWPNLPVPHFNINPPGWKIGDLMKGSIPSLGVRWYAKGAIMTQPTLFGGGEAGPEAVLPLNGFYDYLDRKLSTLNGRTEIIDYDKLTSSIVSGLKKVGIYMSDKQVGKLVAKEVGNVNSATEERMNRLAGVK